MNPWSREEADCIVSDYFTMLLNELQGKPYSKTAHRNRLMAMLPLRNAGAIEKKRQTISAVLLSLGLPHIKGYKPLDNYQGLLIEIIDAHLERHPEIVETFMAYARRPLRIPMQRDLFLKAVVVDPPKMLQPVTGQKQRQVKRILKKYAFVAAEAHNTGLQEAGRSFVADLERARLRETGDPRQTRWVEKVPGPYDSGAPYDILSRDMEGAPLYIKVKTTACDLRFPFRVSASELAFSKARPEAYRLYRLFDFPENPRLFILKGRLHDAIRLTPEAFRARFE